jgi:hypothetical protein
MELHEAFTVLALHPQKGRLMGACGWGTAPFAAACLQSLDGRGAVRMEGRHVVAKRTAEGGPVLGPVLATLAASRPRTPAAWLWRLRPLRLRGHLLHGLHQAGLVQRTATRRWLFTTVRYIPTAAARAQALALLDTAPGLLDIVVAAGLLRATRPGLTWGESRAARRTARRNPYAKALLDAQAAATAGSTVVATSTY